MPYIRCDSLLASRILQVLPKCTPSDGETNLRFIGIGFTENANQQVMFNYAGNKIKVQCNYDKEHDFIRCIAPNFEGQSEFEIKEWPISCQMEVSLDGLTFIPCEDEFLIYGTKISPKKLCVVTVGRYQASGRSDYAEVREYLGGDPYQADYAA